MRLKGDKTVNHVLESRLERESAWKKKSSTIVAVNTIFKDNVENKKISIPEENGDNKKKNRMINPAKKRNEEIS